MPKRRDPKPEPQPTNVVCSLCGEAWSRHQEVDGEVTTLECIRLLRAKTPTPLVIYRDRYPWYPQNPQWTYTSGGITSTAGSTTTYNTPSVVSASHT